MVNPVMLTAEAASATPLVPVYPQTEGINSNYLAKCMRTAFAAAPDIPEPLPAWMLQKYRLCPKADAVRMIHFPHSTAEIASARRRLIFEELLALQLGLLLLRSRDATLTGAPMKPVDLQPFWASLPFSPTGAQKRAAQEILADFNKLSPMNRLLQGDVGSGKTLVAAAGIYAAWKNGYQSALMAPTEILAAQHAETLSRMLEPLGVRVALLTGSVKGAAKKAVRKAIAEGEANLVVGTHAVLGPDVEFRNLGFAVDVYKRQAQHSVTILRAANSAVWAGSRLGATSTTSIPITFKCSNTPRSLSLIHI